MVPRTRLQAALPVGRPQPFRKTRWALVVLLLVTHATLAALSMQRKSHTSDEVLFVTGGLSYWKFNDYRLTPEAGQLSMRWATLPAWLGNQTQFPPHGGSWDQANVWTVGHQLFYEQDNDLLKLIFRARAMIVAMSVLLALLVYQLSARLFGRNGGMISLALYCFSPTMLAHARLVTADLVFAAVLLAAVAAIGALLQRITLARLAASSICVPLVMLAKVSGILVLAIAALLIVVRQFDSHPWPLRLWRMARDLTARRDRVVAVAAIAMLHVGVALLVIWAAFGFRYSMVHDPGVGNARSLQRWESLQPDDGDGVDVIGTLAQAKLLPEGYLFGFAYQLKTSQKRRAFAAGRHTISGWDWYFPYAAAIKTPLTTMGLLLAALLALAHRIRHRSAREQADFLKRWLLATAPFLALIATYGALLLSSRLNIGHRHLLPLYPALFVLLGTCGYWMRPGFRVARLATSALLLLAVITSLSVWPDYLSYFNPMGGGPSGGYRRLVDSSLDWGQDLPALAAWIDRERAAGREDRVYLGYFGNAEPAFYGIEATLLPGVPDRRSDRETLELGAGTYAISATLLQTVLQTPMGPWCEPYEQIYQHDLAALRLWHLDHPGTRVALTAESPGGWPTRMRRFEEFRAARLYAALRKREPDDHAGHSILIYRMTEADVRAALDGPAAELAAGIEVETR